MHSSFYLSFSHSKWLEFSLRAEIFSLLFFMQYLPVLSLSLSLYFYPVTRNFLCSNHGHSFRSMSFISFGSPFAAWLPFSLLFCTHVRSHLQFEVKTQKKTFRIFLDNRLNQHVKLNHVFIFRKFSICSCVVLFIYFDVLLAFFSFPFAFFICAH